MPRAASYKKNPEKYNRKVKAKRFKKQFDEQGFFVSPSFLKIGQRYDIVSYGEDLIKQTEAKTLARALRIVTKEIGSKKLYSCDGYSFVPLTVFEEYFAGIVVVMSTWDVGQLRVEEWIPILKEAYPRKNNYTIYINRIQDEGVDVLVRKDGMPHTVIELTNYNKNCYLSFKDVKRYVDNLTYWDKYNAYKVVVVSFPENLKNRKQPDLWEVFPKNGIGIKVMGYQAQLKTI